MGPEAPLIVDTGVIYSGADLNDPDFEAAQSLLKTWPGELVVSAFVVAEADYLLLDRLVIDVELRFIESLATDFTIALLDREELISAHKLCLKYRDLELGLADASSVILADRWRTSYIATFDERHFRSVQPIDGAAFRLLPIDPLE